MIIHHVLFTSGMGGGYRIIGYSKKISERIQRLIEEKALVKGLFPPDVKFIDAIRKFRCSNYTCISYITSAGTDELGRSGRLRAHIFFIPRSLSSYIFDPRIFDNYFIKEDVTGELSPIEINTDKLYSKLKQAEKRVLEIRDRIIDIVGRDNLILMLKHLLLNNDVLIYPNREIDVLKISSEKISSMDVISLIFFMIPDNFREFIEYSTISFSQQDDVNLSFLWPYSERIEIQIVQSGKYFFLRERRIEKFVNELSQLFLRDLSKFRLLKSLITLYIESIEKLKDPDTIDRILSVSKNIYEGLLK